MDLAPVAGVVVIIGVLVGALTVARRWAAGATSTVKTRAVDQERSRGFAGSHRRQGFPPHTVEGPVAESSDSASATDAPAGSTRPPHAADSNQTRE
jgi:hypothetical protein